jgi:opacity protein-like surface antigen
MVRLVPALLLIVAAGASHAQPYWRADAGYSGTVNAGIRDNNFASDRHICGPSCATAAELDDIGQSVVLSAGVGWRLSRNLRADVEFGYRGWYELKDSDASLSKFSADIVSVSALLGVYWDFAVNWGQARPYLGAGVGVASNKIDPITETRSLVGQGMLGTDSLTVPGGTWSGAAWSLMAGIQFPLDRRLTVDAGYRYVDLGRIESDPGSLTCAPTPCQGITYSGMSGRLRAHELMLGLRF